MTHFPQSHQKQRAIRLEFHGRVPASLRFEDGRRLSGRLRRVSLTGGLLRVPRPLVAGTLADLIFISPNGAVLGIAEFLNPVSTTLKCLQPFKFIMIDDDNYQRLQTLILAPGGSTSFERIGWIERM